MKLITFAAANPEFTTMAKTLLSSGPDYESIMYGEHFLKSCDDFWNNHGKFIRENRRGYGYWVWKPFIIQHTMLTMRDGEVLFYCDSDFILVKDRTNINRLLENVKTQKIITAYTGIKELQWSKMDTILRIGAKITSDDIQIQAGTLLIYVCNETRALIDEWYSICCENNYKYINDTPSLAPNDKCFESHKHDQSILSPLLKKHNIPYGTDINTAIESKKIKFKQTRKRTRHRH